MTALPSATARLRALWPAIAALLALLAAPAFAQSFPKLSGLVVDAANVIPDDQEAALTARLEAFQQRTKRQLVVATIPDLEGRDIADYGYRLGRAWGVGLNEVNNGTVLIVAPNERKLRVEVGYGLEPVLTDALSSVIINQTIVPRFKAGDIPGGIAAGADALMNQLGLPDDEAKAKVAAAEAAFNKQHQRARGGGGGSLLPLAFWGFVLLFVFLSMARGRGRNRGWHDEGRFGGSALPIVLWSIANEIGRGSRGGGGGFGGFGGGGGGGSDGSWGGGGFTGGGGGSFGGGGASGEW